MGKVGTPAAAAAADFGNSADELSGLQAFLVHSRTEGGNQADLVGINGRTEDDRSLAQLLQQPFSHDFQRIGIDAIKLRSCLTLFEAVAPEEPVFADLLDDFYAGERDAATLALLG